MRHSALAWLGHPLTIGAALVLLLNDHLLKWLWPGVVTGKLSDVAGMIVAPPLLGLLVRRPAASILLVGVVFTLVKTTATGATIASHAWTLVWGPSQVLADPTDLIALPALYAAWWTWRHPAPRAERLARVAVVIPVTVVAVAATAPGYHIPQSAYAVDVIDGEFVVAVRQGGLLMSHTSADAGKSWSRRSERTPATAKRSACVPGHCYRIVPGRLAVEESRNGRWVTAWEVSLAAQDRLARAHAADREQDAQPVESLGIAVREISGGHIVVVANGADGIAVRDIAGSWQRLGVNGAGFEAASAVSLTAPGVYPDYVPRAAVLGALAAALLAVGCGVRRRTFFIGSVLAWTAVWSFYEIRNELFIPFNPFALGLGLVLVPVAGFFMIHGATLGRARFRTWAVGLATGVLCFYSIMTPFYAWSAHLLDYYALASGLAIGLGIATASAGAFAVIELDASGSPSPSAPAAP